MRIILILLAPLLMAGGMPMPAQDQEQTQVMKNDISTAATASVSGVTASGGNSSMEFNSTVKASAPDIILVPNNNTERCLRVWGLSFSNTSGGGGIGIPWRSKKCDFEQAADDAFAAGQHKLGWYWKCQNSNLYKRMGSPEECLTTVLSLYTQEKPAIPVVVADKESLVTVNCEVGQHPKTHERIFKACQAK